MAKYFKGAKSLPSAPVVLAHDAVCEESLSRIVNDGDGSVVLSVMLPGLPSSSLGYVFIVRPHEERGRYSVLDISGVAYFREVSAAVLARAIRHASGIEFDPEMHAEFCRIRNQIGGGAP